MALSSFSATPSSKYSSASRMSFSSFWTVSSLLSTSARFRRSACAFP
jgi:hypothetical protein